MKNLMIAFMIFSTSVAANAYYCDDDSGELFSEVTDAWDTSAQFRVVGLDPKNYPKLKRTADGGEGPWEGSGIDAIIEELERVDLEEGNKVKTMPEIRGKLEAWEKMRCDIFEGLKANRDTVGLRAVCIGQFYDENYMETLCKDGAACKGWELFAKDTFQKYQCQ